jgi:hypothetical protein
MPENGKPSSVMASSFAATIWRFLVREGDGVKIFEETVDVAGA